MGRPGSLPTGRAKVDYRAFPAAMVSTCSGFRRRGHIESAAVGTGTAIAPIAHKAKDVENGRDM